MLLTGGALRGRAEDSILIIPNWVKVGPHWTHLLLLPPQLYPQAHIMFCPPRYRALTTEAYLGWLRWALSSAHVVEQHESNLSPSGTFPHFHSTCKHLSDVSNRRPGSTRLSLKVHISSVSKQ